MLVIGRVGPAYGIKGWNHIQSYTETAGDILKYPFWYLRPNKTADWQKIEITSKRAHGKNFVAHLGESIDREQAELLKGSEIAVPRDELPNLSGDEFYWVDLEGMDVVNKENTSLGKVEYLYETAANDVLVVKLEDNENHIPFVIGDTVITVEKEHKKITVDWDVNF